MEQQEKPILIYMKNVEKTTNKLRLPTIVVNLLGKKIYMEVYKDKVVLKSVEQEN